jgi:hypothetical protein
LIFRSRYICFCGGFFGPYWIWGFFKFIAFHFFVVTLQLQFYSQI